MSTCSPSPPPLFSLPIFSPSLLFLDISPAASQMHTAAADSGTKLVLIGRGVKSMEAELFKLLDDCLVPASTATSVAAD